MANSTATITLKVDTRDFTQKLDGASGSLAALSLAGQGASLGLRGLSAAARSSLAEFALGAVAVEKLELRLSSAAISASKTATLLNSIADVAGGLTVASTAVGGISAAYSEFNRIGQTLQALEASGVTTRSIAEFAQMRQAIVGNQEALEGFVSTAIGRLGQFEQAAARSATILRSSTRFDDSGQALRANREEAFQNALSIQKLVNTELDNGVTSIEALSGQYEVLSGGFTSQAASEKVLAPALKLTQIARAGGQMADAGENVRLLVKSLQAYNLSADEAAKTAAIINSVVDNGITTIQELSNGFGAAGNSANKAGISMSALGAGVALLTSQGQDTAEALTGLQGIADTIINKTPEAAQEIAKLSYEGKRIRFDVAEVQAKGFTKALIDLYKAAGSSPQNLAKIFPDSISYRTAIALLAQDGARLQSIFESVNSVSAQSLDEVAKIATDTRINSIERLVNKFGELIITVAQSVAPVVEPGLNALKGIADGFSSLPEPVQQAVGAWIAFQIQSKAATAAVGALASMMVNIGTIYMTNRAIGLLLSGQMGAELITIKELIIQRKGLMSVILQTIGINQRHRLSVEATTDALKNQGVVARKVADLQQKASSVVRGVIDANIRSAQTTAQQISSAPTVKAAAATANPLVQQARDLAGRVAGNPTVAAVAQSARQFWSEVNQQVAARTLAPAPVAAPPQPTADRAYALAQSAVAFNSPQTVQKFGQINQDLSKTIADLEFQSRIYNGKLTALQRLRQRYLDRAAQIEQSGYSPDRYQAEQAKQNKLATKIRSLQESVKASDATVARLSVDSTKLQAQSNQVNTKINAAVDGFAAQFAPAIAAGERLERVSRARDKAIARATTLGDTAENLSAISPNSIEAIEARRRAGLAQMTSDKLISRAAKIEAEYQSLLDSTGARKIMLAEQGLAQARLGGRVVTYQDTGIERLLYAGLIENLKDLKSRVLPPLTSGLAFVSTSAKAAGAALGNLPKIIFSGKLAESIRSGAIDLVAAARSGGIRGLASAGVDKYLGGTAAIGEKLLPFLGPALAGAAGTVGVTALAGAIVTRDDISRNATAMKFNATVAETLKKDEELRNKYGQKIKPIAEIKLAVSNLTDKSGQGRVDPIRLRLKQLQESSQITGDQFQKLDAQLQKMGKSSAISKEEVGKFTAQLDAIRVQDKPVEKGVLDTLWSLPGAILGGGLNLVDFLANSSGGAIGSGAEQIWNVVSGQWSKVGLEQLAADFKNNQSDREGDAILRMQGEAGKLLDRTIAAADLSEQAIVNYRTGGAIDRTNATKLKSGQLLNTVDIERENLAVNSQIAINQNIISGFDKQLKLLTDQIEKSKDPGTKSALQAQVNALEKARDATQKNTDGLKAAQAAFEKYNRDTLPGLIRTLKETNDPDKAIALSEEDFNQLYQKDAQGQLTSYYKDVATLRQDSAKYLEAVNQKYALDNSASAEASAIKRLQSIRDNRITLPTGDSGFRESLQTRLSITDQIVKLQAAETEKVLAAKTLETEKIKLLVAESTLSEREAQERSAEITIAVSKEKLAAKQREIQEYAQFPRKVVELEQESAMLQVQLQQQLADREKAIRDRRLSLRQEGLDLELERLKTLQSTLSIGGIAALERQTAIEVKKSTLALNKLYQDRARLMVDSPELNNQIKRAEEQRAQVIADSQNRLFDARLNLAQKFIDLNYQLDSQPIAIDNKQIDLAQKMAEINSKLTGDNRDLINSQLDLDNARLENESKLTGVQSKRAEIELAQSKFKLATLDRAQAFDRESLRIQLELFELSNRREKNQIETARIEATKAVKNLELQKSRLERDRSNSPESKAASQELELQLTAARQQLAVINQQGIALDKQIESNRQITAIKNQQAQTSQILTREAAATDMVLREINLKTARITQAVEQQSLAYTSQINGLNARSGILDTNTRQLESQSKILETQKGLVGAIADSRITEMGILDSLTTIEGVKADIAQRVAVLKLSNLNQQIALEREILELNIQQQEASLERDRIKQSIAEKQGEAEVIRSRSEVAKLLAQGSKADPNQLAAAKLDLQAKEQQLALTKSQWGLLDKQTQLVRMQSEASRIQFDLSKKNQLQTALADVAKNTPGARGDYQQNSLFNAIGRDESLEYYRDWAQDVVENAPQLKLPNFRTPYDQSSNYNSSSRNPAQLRVPTTPTRAGSLDLSVDLERSQRDAIARYQEFVTNPISIQVSAPPPKPSKESGKTIVVNLQMNNDTSINVADGKETKASIAQMTFSAIEDVVRMVQERY